MELEILLTVNSLPQLQGWPMIVHPKRPAHGSSRILAKMVRKDQKAHFEITVNQSLSFISPQAKMADRSGEREMETGEVRVEKVGGKSTVTRCFSKYPLKFIIPRKVNFDLLFSSLSLCPVRRYWGSFLTVCWYLIWDLMGLPRRVPRRLILYGFTASPMAAALSPYCADSPLPPATNFSILIYNIATVLRSPDSYDLRVLTLGTDD